MYYRIETMLELILRLVPVLHGLIEKENFLWKMKSLQLITLCNIFLVAAVSSETNVIINGDFESGAKEPWICNGCAGYVVHPGYNSDSSYIVESRKACLLYTSDAADE